MYKKQMTVQKLIVMFMLIACALSFLASLGFLTGAYEVLYPGISQRGDAFKGASLYNDFQPYNTRINNISIILIVVSLLLFITGCNTRRKYYISNYIASIAVSVFSIGASVKCIIDVLTVKNVYLTEVDFEKLYQLYQNYLENPLSKKYVYSKSTIWFDLCLVAYILVIVAAILVIANLIWKIILMNSEQKLLNVSKEVFAND